MVYHVKRIRSPT